jgi:hypothetical protein
LLTQTNQHMTCDLVSAPNEASSIRKLIVPSPNAGATMHTLCKTKYWTPLSRRAA